MADARLGERMSGGRRALVCAVALALASAAAGCAAPASERAQPTPHSPASRQEPADASPSPGLPAADEPGIGSGSASEPADGTPGGAGAEAVPDVSPPPEPPLERSVYDIRLRLDPERHRLDGTTQVRARNGADAAANEVKFNLFLNAFDDEARAKREPVLREFRERAYPPGSEGGRIDVERVAVNGAAAAYDVDGTVLTIALERPWTPGETLEIELEWRAAIPRIHHRTGVQDGAFWFGNALPILAVFDGQWRTYAYEAVGDPFFSEAADYRVEVTAPADYRIVATGDESEPEIDAASGTATTRIDAPTAREFAFAASADHRRIGGTTSGGVAVNVYYRLTTDRRAKETLQRSIEMIETMEAAVGPYPYGEMDIFENEMFVTGMEYAGLAFVRSDRLNSAAGYETVVHEIAHQWFYNVVGNDQVAEPWLDEAFATYFTDVYMHGDKLDAVYADRRSKLSASTAVGDVRSYDRWSTYWTANYRKGSLMLHALRGELGEDAFFAFLRAYYETFRFGVVTEAGFRETAQRFADGPLDAFFAAWLE